MSMLMLIDPERPWTRQMPIFEILNVKSYIIDTLDVGVNMHIEMYTFVKNKLHLSHQHIPNYDTIHNKLTRSIIETFVTLDKSSIIFSVHCCKISMRNTVDDDVFNMILLNIPWSLDAMLSRLIKGLMKCLYYVLNEMNMVKFNHDKYSTTSSLRSKNTMFSKQIREHFDTIMCPEQLYTTCVNFKPKFHFLKNFSVINEKHVFDSFNHVVFVYIDILKGQRSFSTDMRNEDILATSAYQLLHRFSIKKHEFKGKLTVELYRKDGILKISMTSNGKNILTSSNTRLTPRKCNVFERSKLFCHHHDYVTCIYDTSNTNNPNGRH